MSTTVLPRASVAPRYAAASGGAVLGAAVGFARSGAVDALAVGALFAVLAAASVVDLQERRIPNRLTYPAIVVTLAVAILGGEGMASIGGLALAGGFMFVAALVGGDQLGMGDVKLSALAGAALGIEGVPVYLVAGTLTGAIVAVAVLLRKRDRRATLPYGPSLAAGAAIAAVAQGAVIG